ncbi:penicillin-binding protein 2 [Vibrio coralliirubri]|uniref:penicillin-binding protein 2 n=1 Tax=Vibrio coralliirubri TaxID=1516159 RepID=UPI0022844F60|nr:penicillin-binding protein 2 [Vibrio coralliirubri]MCY9861250.1 penicillin-binding protein 2 [Vibrio coralliirubri]
MKKGQQIRSRNLEKKTINGRAKLSAAFILACLMGIGYKVYDLQVNEHAAQYAIAKSNTIKGLSTSPERGDIVDRNGVLIAGTRPMYDLVVIPERLSSYRRDRAKAVDDYLDMLSKFIPILEDEQSRIKKKILQSRSYAKVIVFRDLNQTNLSVALENLGYLEGTSIAVKKVRYYPYKGAFLSPLGYVGRVDADDIKTSSEQGYSVISSDYIGKMGLEDEYNKTLYGVIGKETVALDSRGRVVERKIASRPQKGETLKLTLDADLQIEAHKLMNGKKGAVIIQDIHTGEVLTALSMPDVDPNMFMSAMSQQEVNDLYSNKRPLFNRVARGQYPPASVVKPFMSIAALEGEFIKPESVRWSGPYFTLGGHKFRDWKRDGHGNINMEKAIGISSDVYFYRLADSMGIDYIHDALTSFGFGFKTGINIAGEGDGLLPSSEWKRRVKGEPWYGGETVTVGIGQGFFMATPIQMNNALVTLLNGGVLYKPSMVSGSESEVISKVNLTPSYLDAVKDGMEAVVFSKYGTGRGIRRIAEVDMAGKTGTSQVFSTLGKIDYENDEMPEHLRDHAVWSGYVPMDKPEIAITVFVENGGSGSTVAAPIAQRLANLYAKKYIHKSIDSNKVVKTDSDSPVVSLLNAPLATN